MQAPIIGMSAREAREAGIQVPGHVPDVATFEIVSYRQLSCDIGEGGAVKVNIEATGIWRWINVTAQINHDTHCKRCGADECGGHI